MITGKWNKSLSCQPCDQEGDPLPGTELKEIWRVAPAPQNDGYQYTHFAHKINSFNTAPKKLLASDSRLRPDRYAIETGDMSKLEDQFTPRWFNVTDAVASTPWGDLQICEYSGKYTEHRAAIDSSSTTDDETDVTSVQFDPWQYGGSSSSPQ
uniref:Uncharacterized protein n=1 Tax=Zea mays TaxID=4577 RepID=A0A804MBV9_MAIZE